MPRTRNPLGVLEGKWQKNKNTSVKPLFDLLFDRHFDDEHAYHYEMFNTEGSFKHALKRLGRQAGRHYVYIAAHGSTKHIYGAGDAPVRIKAIASVLDELADEGAVLHGIYFSTCYAGSEETAQMLLRSAAADRVQLQWVAGYPGNADWGASYAIDGYFWDRYLDRLITRQSRAALDAAVADLRELMPGARTVGGFDVFVRDRAGGVKSLLSA